MKVETLHKIITKIIKLDKVDIIQLEYEEGNGYYNVWKIESNGKTYILKKSNINEVNIYENIKDEILPNYYGFVKYYNNYYILIEHIDGNNLMKANKEDLIKLINSLINIQKKYWNTNQSFGIDKNKTKERVINRRNYLYNEELILKYDKFLECYEKCDTTFTHFDLLPFNVIVGESAKLIDMEYVGDLPYPLSICRLIAHTKDDPNYLFYMSEEDKEFIVKYYYDNLISNYDITYEEYIYTIKCFLFYEYTEWVYVFNKSGLAKNERFDYYYKKCIELEI